MSLKIYQSTPYNHTHEREQFEDLCNICIDCFSKTEEKNLLFANINLNGAPLDALLVKPDAIIMIEFKDYGGSVVAAENGKWKLSDGTIVRGGASTNPFVQTQNNKYNVMHWFEDYFYTKNANLGHIAGVVVFKNNMEIDDRMISRKSKSWFFITDMEHVSSKLKNITSPKMEYNDVELEELPQILNFDEIRDLVYPNIDEIVDKIEEENDTIVEDVITETDDSDDRPPTIRTSLRFSESDPAKDFNGGKYRGDWDWDIMKPDGRGFYEKGDIIYEGTWEQGSPVESAVFKITSADESFIFQGKISQEMKPLEGYMMTEIDNVKREYDGTFDKWRLQNGIYKKNGILRSIGTFKYTPQHDGALHMELVEGRIFEEKYNLGNGSIYTGLVDIKTKLPEDEEGELVDAKGNRFVGPFKNGKKNGRFKVYISGEQEPIQCDYKDDVEL